jgi:hypothetical protein
MLTADVVFPTATQIGEMFRADSKSEATLLQGRQGFVKVRRCSELSSASMHDQLLSADGNPARRPDRAREHTLLSCPCSS